MSDPAEVRAALDGLENAALKFELAYHAGRSAAAFEFAATVKFFGRKLERLAEELRERRAAA